jgi:hypothetical protein
MVSKYPSQAPAPKFEEAGKIAHVRIIAVPGFKAGVKGIAGLLLLSKASVSKSPDSLVKKMIIAQPFVKF